MLSLIVTIIFGVGIAYYAFQNAVGVPVNFVTLHLTNVPLYFVVLTAVLSGIIMAWVISAINGMSHFMSMRGKDNVIQKDRREIENLRAKIHDLEIENAGLREQKRGIVVENAHETVADENIHEDRPKAPFFNRLLHPRIG